MKKLTPLCAMLAALLGGCASVPQPDFLRNAASPQIVLDAKTGPGSFTVSPPTLIFPEGQGRVNIVWRLPDGAAKAGLRFAERNGIFINGEIISKVRTVPLKSGDMSREGPGRIVLDGKQTEIVDCTVGKDGLEYSCVNLHTRPGLFKYTITLTDGANEYILDPEVANW